MVHRAFRVDSHMSESVIEYLFLSLKVRHDVSVKLCLQLKTHSLDICNVVSHLQLAVLFSPFLTRFGYEVLEYELRFFLRRPAYSAIIRS